MGMFGDMWVVESCSFLCRVGEILAMSCILMPEKPVATSYSELVFVLSCGAVFFLNCFEFSGTPRENLIVQLFAMGIGLLGTSLLLANAHPKDHIYPAKFYATIFSGVSVTGCFISGADFYFHIQTGQ